MRCFVLYEQSASLGKCCCSHGGERLEASQMTRHSTGPRGATVARLTPDQKVACSNHVGVIYFIIGRDIDVELTLT